MNGGWVAVLPRGESWLVRPRSFERCSIEGHGTPEATGPQGAVAKVVILRTTLESKIKSLKISKNRFKPDPSKDG
jgi:hypothetical protein